MREREIIDNVFKELDRIAFWVSLVVITFLVIVYFLLPSTTIDDDVQYFLQSVITNFIPTILLFMFSYILVRKFQKLRSEYNQETTVQNISRAVSSIFDAKIDRLIDSVDQFKVNLNGIRDALFNLSQKQEGSNQVIGILIDKLAVSPKDMVDLLGSAGKLGQNRRLPITTKKLPHEEKRDNNED
jgi:Mg2+ and Co2+ transporter CorA